MFKCRNKTAPEYLADDLQWAADDSARTRLRSISFVQQTRHAQVATIIGWRPRLWRRRTSPVEQSAGMRHLSEYTSVPTSDLQETFENTPV